MALLPPFCLDAVIALGTLTPDGSMQYKATGFLYGHPIGESDGQAQYSIFLVTNRHVIEGVDKLQARLNRPMGSESKIYNVPLTTPDGSTLWTLHPDSNCDVAVIPISIQLLEDDGIEFRWFAGDKQLNLTQAKEIEVSEGDGVFVLGFPLGIAGQERNFTIVRQGMLARVRDWLEGISRTILIDASIFPGNSGGPVITKPESVAIRGTKNNSRAQLIGMVSSYLPYDDIAVSPQTGKPRVIFQENSGLANVVPIDVIQETIEIAAEKD